MTSVSIGHLVHTDRPLTWRSQRSCPRCTLPFTSNTSDEPVHRVALLLDCKHVLCGQCVQEHTLNRCITCEVCKRQMKLAEDRENVTQAFHPSLFLLGVLQQSKYEMNNVDCYWQGDEEGCVDEAPRPRCLPSEKLRSTDIETPAKMLLLLEKAYHEYEKSKKHIENKTKMQQDNVCRVIEQINAHFVEFHNALQLEENRVLQEVRKAYIERCQQNKKDEHQLNMMKSRLHEFIRSVRRFSEGKSEKKRTCEEEDWQHFSDEVKQFLEYEPVKLNNALGKLFRPPIHYLSRSTFLKDVASCHSLKIDEMRGDPMLVPIMHKNGRKTPERSGRSASPKNDDKERKSFKASREKPPSGKRREETIVPTNTAEGSSKQQRWNDTDKRKHKRSGVKEVVPSNKSASTSLAPSLELTVSTSTHNVSIAKPSERALVRKASFADRSPELCSKDYSTASSICSSSVRSAVGKSRGSSKKEARQKSQPEEEQKWRTVHVTSVVSPREFYVQEELFVTEGASQMSELCSGDAKAYESQLIMAAAPPAITPGKLYLVRPEACKYLRRDKNWYRAEVLAEETEPNGGMYRVQYVDYGLTDMVRQEQIRPMSEELANRAYMAMRCALYELQPAAKDRQWTEACRQVMTDFIGNQPMLMHELGNGGDGETSLVDLILPPPPVADSEETSKDHPSKHWHGRYGPMSLRDALIYMGLAEVSTDIHQEDRDARLVILRKRIAKHRHWLRDTLAETVRCNSVPRSPVLQEHDQFDCVITQVESIEHFHMMPTEWKKKLLNPLKLRLNTICRQTPSAMGLASTKSALSKVYCPYVGLVCAFVHYDRETDTDVWERGRVLHLNRARCTVLALDTGETREVGWSDMRLLAPDDPAFNVHPLAVRCSLGHVRPHRTVPGMCWTQEAIDEFRQIACSRTLRFAVSIGRREPVGGGIYSVVLYLVNKREHDTCVNGLLVRNGHAECVGSEENIQDRVRQFDPDEFTVVPDEVAPVKGETRRSVDDRITDVVPAAVVRVPDPRIPVIMLRVVSPGEFYVLLCGQQAGLDQLHQTIQEHMDDRIDEEEEDEDDNGDGDGGAMANGGGHRSKRAAGDVCVVFARVNEGVASEWHRARIETVHDDGLHYEVFLIDRAVTTKVHRTNVARLTARMAQIQPGAIRCRLACVTPVAGNTIWHLSTVDAFRETIDGYSQHAISLDSKPAPDSGERALSVVLWGIRIQDQHALEPTRTVYHNFNKMLAKQGLVHLSGRFRTFATSGPGAVEEHQLLEDAIGAQLRHEYDQMEQFFRTAAIVQGGNREQASNAGVGGGGGGGTGRDGSKAAENVLNELQGMDDWMKTECYPALTQASLNSGIPVHSWLPAVRLEKTVFVCVPTYIGSDGIVYLHDVVQEPILDRIQSIIQQDVQSQCAGRASSSIPGQSYIVGRACLARFHLDGQYYRGKVAQELGRGRYMVLFVDYGNVEECSLDDLRPATVCGQVPVQVTQMRLFGVRPREEKQDSGHHHHHRKGKRATRGVTHKWPEQALDTLHSLIVQKRCAIRIELDGECSSRGFASDVPSVPYCSLRLLELQAGGTADVAEILVELGLFEPHDGSHRSGKGSFSPASYHPEPSVRISHGSERTEPINELMHRSSSSHRGASSGKPQNSSGVHDTINMRRWIEEIETQALANLSPGRKEQTDPNEWSNDEDDSLGPLNRAQLIDVQFEPGVPDVDESTASSATGGGRLPTTIVEFIDSSSIPSPATLNSEEFETSSRLSDDGRSFSVADEACEETEPLRDGRTASPLFRSFPVLPLPDASSYGFFADYANYGRQLTLYVYPHLDGHRVRCNSIAERVQRRARSTNELHLWQASLLEPGAPCLAPFHEDGLYYRAIVETRDEERREVSVLFVDYLNRETVPLADLRKCPIELQRAPLRNIPVRLAGVRTNPRLRDTDVGQRLSELLEKPFFVKLVDREPLRRQHATLLPVELYTDANCHTLVYQEMLDERYFLPARSHAVEL